MATRVKFSELELAFDYVSFEGLTEHLAYVRKDTGEILYGSDDLAEEELPDDVNDEEKYLAIPSKRDLDLGKSLVFICSPPSRLERQRKHAFTLGTGRPGGGKNRRSRSMPRGSASYVRKISAYNEDRERRLCLLMRSKKMEQRTFYMVREVPQADMVICSFRCLVACQFDLAGYAWAIRLCVIDRAWAIPAPRHPSNIFRER